MTANLTTTLELTDVRRAVERALPTVRDNREEIGAGPRGTGSHHVRADDVVVDADHTCTLLDRPWPDGSLWRMPLFSVILPMLAAAPLGIARGALDEIIRQAREGWLRRTGGTRSESFGGGAGGR